MAQNRTFILGVGAQKSGTTWLYKYLDSYDGVDAGFTKEYHIWDALHSADCNKFRLSWRETLRSSVKRKRRRMQRNTNIYFDYFADILDSDRTHIALDITPSYAVLDSKVFKQIIGGFRKRDVHCKVVFLMRDPVERCWSCVRMHKKIKNTKEPVINNFVSEEQAVIEYSQSRHAHLRTRYDKTINELEKAFAIKDIYVGVYEELMSEQGIENISKFVGIEPNQGYAKVTVNTSPKTTILSDEARRLVANEYKPVYEMIAEKFPQTKSLWAGNEYIP